MAKPPSIHVVRILVLLGPLRTENRPAYRLFLHRLTDAPRVTPASRARQETPGRMERAHRCNTYNEGQKSHKSSLRRRWRNHVGRRIRSQQTSLAGVRKENQVGWVIGYMTVRECAALTRSGSKEPRWRFGLVCCRISHGDLGPTQRKPWASPNPQGEAHG